MATTRSALPGSLFLLCVALVIGGIMVSGCDSRSVQSDVQDEKLSDDSGDSEVSGEAEFGSKKHGFSVKQGGQSYCVTALSHTPSDGKAETIEEYYGYNEDIPAASNPSTDIEKEDVSNLFLFEGPKGTSLVVLHDTQFDDEGGSVIFDFRGLPKDGSWVIQDDPIDFNSGSSVSWGWTYGIADGGAFRGGLDDDFSITIDPTFEKGIIQWDLLSGDAENPKRMQLDMNEPVTITPSCRIEVTLDIKPDDTPNAVNPNSKGVTPTAILHTENFDPAAADVSTLRFGAADVVDGGNGAEPAHGGHFEDIDDDGDEDLVLHVPTEDTGFDGDEDTGKVSGSTLDDTALFGSDSVKLVGGGPPSDGNSPGNGNGNGPGR